jgi:MoaA/NifB/PqqE/SkfB family radical SAM enzyme
VLRVPAGGGAGGGFEVYAIAVAEQVAWLRHVEDQRRREIMDPARAARLIDDFVRQGGSELTFTGGEPLLYPAIVELAEQAHRADLQVTVFTMGLELGVEPVSRALRDKLMPLVNIWRFSLHGVSAATHDRATNGPGSFRATREVIETLVDAGSAVHATFVAKPNSVDEILDVATMCEDLGIQELRVVSVVPQGRQRERLAPLGESILAAVDDANRRTKPLVRMGNAALAELELPHDCTAFEDELVVSTDGWLSACHIVEPGPSEDDRDNVFRVGLATARSTSPRLGRLANVGCDGETCDRGCLMAKSTEVGFTPPTRTLVALPF